MRTIPKISWLLGYAGLLPFAILFFYLYYEKPFFILTNLPVSIWLATYAAIVLSFLGAVSWGVAIAMQEQLDDKKISRLFIYAVIPSILAWLALLLPIQIALFTLSGLIVFAYIADSLILFPTINSQYSFLRLHLSIAVSLILLLSAIIVA